MSSFSIMRLWEHNLSIIASTSKRLYKVMRDECMVRDIQNITTLHQLLVFAKPYHHGHSIPYTYIGSFCLRILFTDYGLIHFVREFVILFSLGAFYTFHGCF